jgi:hypothetical protein
MLPYKVLEKLAEKHSVLAEKFFKFQKKTLIENKPYPLDFIIRLPTSLLNKNLSKD